MTYYRPPCLFCNLNFSIYDENKIPMICKTCSMTSCYACSKFGRKCPSCHEEYNITENMLLVNDLKETEPHHPTQKPVQFIPIDDFNKAMDVLAEFHQKEKKKKCVIM